MTFEELNAFIGIMLLVVVAAIINYADGPTWLKVLTITIVGLGLFVGAFYMTGVLL